MGHAVGVVEEVYGVATTTVERWMELEPGYYGSVKLTEKTKDDPVYAVFVRGKWSVVGGVSHSVDEQGKPFYPFTAGHAVLDKDGRLLNAQLGGDLPARPAFGGVYNDE
jgi:hypothetical protein